MTTAIDAFEKIQSGEITLVSLMRDSQAVLQMAEKMSAVSSAIHTGDLYKTLQFSPKDPSTCTTTERMAMLLMTLQEFEKATDNLHKAVYQALNGSEDTHGNDGHHARLAEHIRLVGGGQSFVELDELGKFVIKSKPRVIPPGKKRDEEQILKFLLLCTENGFDERICSLDEAKSFAAEHKFELPRYLEFWYWARDRKIITQSFDWKSLQKACEGIPASELPSCVSVQPREEVKHTS